jgi:DNA polymerase (family X)
VENAEIARWFRELGDLLEIDGANPFRVRAYRTAARSIETSPESVETLARDAPGKLTEIPGIGEDLAGKIRELVATGRLAAHAKAARRIPRGLLELMVIPGLGPKKARLLFEKARVRSLADLRRALARGRLAEVRGFGPKSIEKLAQAVQAKATAPARLPRPVAAQYAEGLVEWLRGASGIGQVEVAGSFRRCRDTVGDLDVLVTARDGEKAVDRFVAYPEVGAVLARGTTRAAIRLASGLQVDLRVLEAAAYGAGLYYFTGSKAHNIAVRRRAQDLGLKVNEYGVWRGRKRIAGRTEAEVARAVGLPLIPPELREDRGEIAAALEGRLPKLVTLRDIRGDLQSHTTSSDGRDDLATMARTAAARGYEYFAVTDHSPAVRVTGGLDAAGFRAQRRVIDAWNERGEPPVLLAGAEVDILADGTLDLDDATLAALDLVVISLHSRLTLPRREQTRRVVRALRHPAADVFGHPTGRLLGRRAGADFDLDEICRVAAGEGVLLEINAQPDRLDLDDVAAQKALHHGARLVISTDAHASAELGFMRWGVDQARRGWARAEDIANTRSLARLRPLLHRARHAASRQPQVGTGRRPTRRKVRARRDRSARVG